MYSLYFELQNGLASGLHLSYLYIVLPHHPPFFCQVINSLKVGTVSYLAFEEGMPLNVHMCQSQNDKIITVSLGFN